jgi:hypothetical protein
MLDARRRRTPGRETEKPAPRVNSRTEDRSRRIFILYQHIRKSVNIPNKSGYCFKKTTIHFAHYVRSVAATRRFFVLSRAVNRWLSRMAVPKPYIGLFQIIGGFMRRLTKLLLKAVLVLFCGKSSIFQFIRALLSMREFSTHQSLKGPPFVAVPSFFKGL